MTQRSHQRADLVVILLAALAAYVPFLNKPLFIDDHAIYIQARELVRHPGIPYSMESGKLGWQKGQNVGEDNPPVFFYWLRLIIRYVGEHPWKARAATLPIQIAGLFAFYGLAARYVRSPLWATLLLLVSPHFWVTSNSLLVDSILGPVIWLALWFWMRATEERKLGWGMAAAFFLGLAPLVKYTGLVAWPAAALWSWTRRRETSRWTWGWLVLPVAMFGMWLMYTHHLYGRDHFSAVAESRMVLPSFKRLATMLVFIAGSCPFVWLLAFSIWRKDLSSERSFWLAGALAGMLVVFAQCVTGWSGVGVLVQQLVWAALGGGTIALLCRIKRDDNTWIFWIGWFATGFIGLLFALDWLCARFLVILSAPLAVLTVRWIEDHPSVIFNQPTWRRSSVALLTVFGAFLATADLLQAKADQRAAIWANDWMQRTAYAQQGYYPAAALGGISYYLDARGWKPLDPGAPLPAGAVLITPQRTLPPFFRPTISNPRLLDEFVIPTWMPLRVFDPKTRAGFYGSIWGQLPFSLSHDPIETYALVQSQN